MSDDLDTKIREAVAAITEPAPHDPARLLDLAASIRQTVAAGAVDPKSVYYGRPDMAAQADMNIRGAMARAGVVEPVETPQTIAERQHAAAFPPIETPGLTEMIDQHLATLADTFSADRLAEMGKALRETVGRAEYDRMVADAKVGLEPDEKLQPAALADLTTLKLFAANGRYAAARERLRPKF